MSFVDEIKSEARALTLPLTKQGLSAIPLNQYPVVPPSQGNIPAQWTMEWLGPGRPILPPWTMFRPGSIRGDQADLEWQEPRSFQYTPNVNATITPRAAYGLTPFSQLLFYTDNIPEAALARRLIVEELKSLKPQFKDTSGNVIDPKELPELQWMTKMPDRYTSWSTWLARFWRNIVTYDAAALWHIRDRNDQTIGLRVLDGSTLFVIIDPRGEQPSWPAPAIQQVIWGVPRGWYTTRDIWYRPRMPQLNAPYGTAPIEDAWLPGQWLYNFWTFEVAAYITGTVPDSIVTAPPNWTPDQIFTFEDTFNSRQAGNAAERSARIRMFPNGSAQIATKSATWNKEGYTTAFERILQSFGIPPSETGMYTPGRLGVGSEKDKSESTLYRQVFGPAISFTETAFNDVIHDDYGMVDVTWELGFQPESADPDKEEERTLNRWEASLYTRDHTLEELGQDPVGGDIGGQYYPVKSMNDAALAGVQDAQNKIGIGVRPKQFAINQQIPVKDGNVIQIDGGSGAIPVRGKVKVIKRDVNKQLGKGGEGSGHFGHAGRPGEIGGSAPSGSGGSKIYNDGQPYWRYAKEDDPMSDWGHAMFAANQEHYQPGEAGQGNAYYKFEPKPGDARVASFEDVQGAIISKLNDWQENGVPAQYAYTDIGRAIESGDYTPEELANTFNPSDIVNGAEGYDNADFNQFLYDEILAPGGYGAIVTQDGAVVYDPSMIDWVGKRAPKHSIGKVKVIKRKAGEVIEAKPNGDVISAQPFILAKAVQDIPNLRHIGIGETAMCGNCQYHRDFDDTVYCWRFDSKVQADWMCDEYKAQAEHPDALPLAEQIGKLNIITDKSMPDGVIKFVSPRGVEAIITNVGLKKHCGTCADDDQYFGAPVTREVPIDFPQQGANEAEIVSIGFSDQTPRPALWKPANGENSQLVSAIGGPQYVREEAAWLLDRELNEPDSFLVPVAYVSQIDGEDGAALHYVTGREAAQSVSEYGADWIERAGVLDYILGQTDRHAGNWLTHPDEDDRPILIDNGLAFPVSSSIPINSPFVSAMQGKTLSSDMQLSLKSVVGNKALWQDIAGLVGKDAASAAWERANQLQQEGAIPSA